MKTTFSTISNGVLNVAGLPISRIIATHSLAEIVLRLNDLNVPGQVCGVPPHVRALMVDAVAVAFCDHGLYPPSTIAARLASSCGQDISKAYIAALAAMGDEHAPVARAHRFFSADAELGFKEARLRFGKRVPGFGHPIHTVDPRVEALLLRFRTLFSGKLPVCERASEIAKVLGHPLNYAGASAAICHDIGVLPEYAQLLATMGRMVGLTQHVVEQSLSNTRVVCYDTQSGFSG